MFLYPVASLWSILLPLLLLLVVSTTAHPYPQYSHKIRSLENQYIHPTFHLFPRSWFHTEKRASPNTPHIRRRGLPGAVYVCTRQNFRGDCAWIMPDNKCHIPGTGDNSPESIGPDPDGFCVLFESTTCDGNQIATLRFPGIEDQVPEFGGIQCFADGGKGMNATAATKGLGAFKANADPRLPGGFGSADAFALKSVLAEMEREGFNEGMIGLKKGHYY
ncbi:unnamed protein product [Periconia digitata]|uniref:Uncharacterized protein n=1 Tax=Periconia digitata TaxID=1303443 RepID=A0A9W4UIK2_9PLEO|nr:unnamed protein product [Periconia digitata]